MIILEPNAYFKALFSNCHTIDLLCTNSEWYFKTQIPIEVLRLMSHNDVYPEVCHFGGRCRSHSYSSYSTMVKTCCVARCSRRGRCEGVSFYRIPTVNKWKTAELSAKRRQAWIDSINRKAWIPSSNARVCSDHFLTGNQPNMLC